MKYIIDEKCLTRIMKEIREDLNLKMWKHYAKYATMEIKRIIKYHSARDFSDEYIHTTNS